MIQFYLSSYILYISAIAVIFLNGAYALPQPSKITLSAVPNSKSNCNAFANAVRKSVLFTSENVGVSPLALCTGTASFISGFDVGIIAGALLLLAPAFGLASTPHRFVV